MQLRKDTIDRQKEIVQAARKLIVKYGSEHITIRRIAQEIDVTEGAIYKHFKSKKDVYFFLIDDIEDTLISDIDENYSGDVDTFQSLEKVIIAHISAIEQRKGVTFQVIAEIISLGDRQLKQKTYQVIEKYLERIRNILAEGKNNALIKPEVDLDAAARMFFYMTQGIVNTWALSHHKFDLLNEFKPVWELYVKAITRSSYIKTSTINRPHHCRPNIPTDSSMGTLK